MKKNHANYGNDLVMCSCDSFLVISRKRAVEQTVKLSVIRDDMTGTHRITGMLETWTLRNDIIFSRRTFPK